MSIILHTEEEVHSQNNKLSAQEQLRQEFSLKRFKRSDRPSGGEPPQPGPSNANQESSQPDSHHHSGSDQRLEASRQVNHPVTQEITRLIREKSEDIFNDIKEQDRRARKIFNIEEQKPEYLLPLSERHYLILNGEISPILSDLQNQDVSAATTSREVNFSKVVNKLVINIIKKFDEVLGKKDKETKQKKLSDDKNFAFYLISNDKKITILLAISGFGNAGKKNYSKEYENCQTGLEEAIKEVTKSNAELNDYNIEGIFVPFTRKEEKVIAQPFKNIFTAVEKELDRSSDNFVKFSLIAKFLLGDIALNYHNANTVLKDITDFPRFIKAIKDCHQIKKQIKKREDKLDIGLELITLALLEQVSNEKNTEENTNEGRENDVIDIKANLKFLTKQSKSLHYFEEKTKIKEFLDSNKGNIISRYRESLRKFWKLFNDELRSSNIIKNDARCSEDNLIDYLSYNSDHLKKDGIHYIFSVKRGEKEKKEAQPISIRPPCSYCILHFPLEFQAIAAHKTGLPVFTFEQRLELQFPTNKLQYMNLLLNMGFSHTENFLIKLIESLNPISVIKMLTKYNKLVVQMGYGNMISVLENLSSKLEILGSEFEDIKIQVHQLFSTLLFYATEAGSQDVVKFLIDKGASIDKEKEHKLLRKAIINGNYKVVQALLEDRTVEKKIEMIKTEDDMPPLYLAASFKRPEIFKLLVNNIPEKHRLEVIRLKPTLLQFKKATVEFIPPDNYVNILDKLYKNLDTYLWEPLFAAIYISNFEMVQFIWEELKKGGIKPEQLTVNDREPELLLTPPLYIAVMRGDYEIVEYLINKGFLIEYDFKYTALNIAIALGREQIAILLMERMSEDSIKKSIENKWEKIRSTILHGLSEFGLHGLITHKRLESELKQHVNNKAILFKNNIEEDKDITPLHLASAYGYEKIVTWLLINRAGVNDYTEKGFTSLHLAAQSGHKKVVNDLLEEGAKVNDKTLKGFTPLHFAAQDGHEDVVYTLLKAGADVNDSTYEGFTPLHFAANDGYKDVVEVLLNNGANVNDAVHSNSEDLGGFTPLHCAALKGHKDIVHALLNKGADVNAKTTSDWTPLHCAALKGHKDIVHALLNKGANVNAMNIDDVDHLLRAFQDRYKKEVYIQIIKIMESTQKLFTVIKKSNELNKEQKIRQLIENGGIVGATDNDDGLRLLHFSAREGDIEITKLLLEHGAVYNILGGKSKKTPLQMCKDNSRFSRSNHPKVTLLLEKIAELFDAIENNALEEVTRIIESTKELTFTRAVINAQNESEETPLHFAVKKGHKEVVQTLLNNCADVNTRMKNKTPLHLASEFGQNEIVIILLREGANIDAVNDKGFTPLHLAAENGYKEVVETLLGNNGADIDALNDKDFTPLHLAAKNGYKAVVETLLGNGADIDTVNDKDFTPLHLAVENNHNDVVKVLLRNGANIETTDINGKKPLSYATANDGYDGSIKEILELTGKLFTTIRGNLSKNTKVKNLKVYIKNGGIISATDDKGNTVLHISIRKGLNEVSKLLLSHAKGYLSSSEFKKFVNTINRESREEFAPLHYAAKKGDEEMVKLLLENGAIPNIEGKVTNTLGKKEIKTPLDLVPENKEDIRELLTVGEVIENLLIEVDKCLGMSSGNSERRKREAIECELSWNDDIKKIREGEEDIRDIRKLKINSDKLINFIKSESISENKLTQLIHLAEQVQVTGKSQGLVNKLISNQKFINHLSKVGMISGMTMQSMMAKNVLADAVNGNYQGLAINLGFIALPFGVKAGENAALEGLHAVSKAAYARGFKLAPLVESSLAQSFKLSSSFFARSTSAFIAYDLVKELRNGTVVGVVGDSVYLGVDAAELGIEVAEGFGVLEGVSSVTGPIGATIGAVVFVGTDVYQAVKKVENIDRLMYLTAEERFLEGIRAFVGIGTERHIEELVEEKQLYNQLVKQALEYLKQHGDIQRYVFPTGKLVQDTCNMVQYKEQCPSLDLHSDLIVMPGEPTGLGIRNACHKDENGNLFILKEREECITKFQPDLNNMVLLDKQKPNIKWSRIRPDNPSEGNLFCIPQGHGQLALGLSYGCNNAIGVEYVNNRTSNYTLLDLGDGTDYAKGFKDSNNIFFIGNGNKTISGGEKDDTFILQGNRFEGEISGGNGTNTLDLSKFSPQSKSLFLSFRGNNLPTLGGLIDQISKVITRENKEDIISCKDVSIKYIDGRGGRNENEQDIINIEFDHCHKLFGTTTDCKDYLSGKFTPKVQIMLRDYTVVNNYASKGNFSYFVDQKKGKASVDILSASKNEFIFNNILENIKDINFNSSVDRRTIKFTFSPHNTETLISYRVQNISFTLKDGTVISVSKEGNLYALQNSNKSVDEIINSYSAIANNLKMSIFVHSLLSNESIVVGHGKHDVIENNPEYKSHLVGNGGENIFVVTFDKLPIPEIVLYDVDQENKIDTLDLRKIRKQVESDLNVKIKTRIITSDKDLIVQLFYEKDNEVSESSIAQVRLKNGLLTNWYERLHVIMNHVPMKIEEFELRPLPLVFDNNEEIIRIAAEDVDKNNKIIISQKIEDYTFSKLGNDLIMTFNHNASLILSEFYKNKEMETLTIRFANKEVAIKNELNNVRSFDDLKEEYKNSTASIINSFNTTEARAGFNSTEASNSTDTSVEPLTVMRRNRRDIESNVKSAASRPTSFISTIASTFTNAVIQGIAQFISARTSSAGYSTQCHKPSNYKSSLSQVNVQTDINSTILLLDLLIRRVTGQKYISTAEQSISPQKARDYALSITCSFEKVLAKSSESLDFDWFNKLFRSIEASMISGQYSKVPKILYESAKNICSNPSEKFFSDVERNIEKMLNDMVKENSLSLEERSTTPLASLSNIAIEPVNRRRAIG